VNALKLLRTEGAIGTRLYAPW